MEFFIKPDFPPCPFSLTHKNKFLVLGSCFAEHFSDNLNLWLWHSMTNPRGLMYNPIAVIDLLKSCFEKNAIDHLLQDHYFVSTEDGIWKHWLCHSDFSTQDKESMKLLVKQGQEKLLQFFSQADCWVISLGTNVAYKHKKLQAFVTNCHKFPADCFEKTYIPYQDIVANFREVLALAKKQKSDLKIILTVSPVRYFGEGLVQNQVNKAQLILACNELVKLFPTWVYYFPAYELMMDVLRDYRFYKTDKRHPSPEAVLFILKHFKEQCIDTEERKGLIAEVEKWQKNLAHKPLQPLAIAHKKNMQDLKSTIQITQKKYPKLNWEYWLKDNPLFAE